VILHFIIIALFLLTLACVIGWYAIHRRLDPDNRAAHPHYRVYQVLIASIATLIFSSDPGNPDDYLFWP